MRVGNRAIGLSRPASLRALELKRRQQILDPEGVWIRRSRREPAKWRRSETSNPPIAANLRAPMSGDPSKTRSANATSDAKAGQAGSLPQTKASATDDIAAFVAKARAMSPHSADARGRLIFALDATMSRQPTWDMACALQADMFREAASVGTLD